MADPYVLRRDQSDPDPYYVRHNVFDRETDRRLGWIVQRGNQWAAFRLPRSETGQVIPRGYGLGSFWTRRDAAAEVWINREIN